MTTLARLAPSLRLRTVALAALFGFTTFFVSTAPTELPVPRPEALAPQPAKALACADGPSFEGHLTNTASTTAVATYSTTGNVYAYISDVVDDWSCTAWYRYDGIAWARDDGPPEELDGNFDWGNLINSTSVPCNWDIGETNYIKANSTTDCPDTDAEYALPIFLSNWQSDMLETVWHADSTPDEPGDFGFIHSDCESYYYSEALKENVTWTTSSATNRPGSNCDPYDLESTNTTQSIVVDGTPPGNATISIDGGNAYSPDTSVTLTLSATDNLSGVDLMMQFSNDGTNWSSLETYATTKAWTLASGAGTKTVRVKYQDENGNLSGAVSDTIVLDTTTPEPDPPTIACTDVTNAVYQAADNGVCFLRPAAASTVTITATASDAQSGITHLRFQNLSPATGWTPSPSLPNNDTTSAYTQALGFSGSAVTATLGVLAKNGAQADGSVRTVTLQTDTEGPRTTFTSPSAGTTQQSSDSVTVSWTAADYVATGSGTAGSGIKSPTSLKRQKATWDGTTCGSYADDAAFTPTAAASPVNDSGLLVNTCYRWVQTLTDQVGNTLATTSGVVVREMPTNLGKQRQHTFESWDLGGGDSLAANVATRNVVISHPLFDLPIRGSSVDLALTYNSHEPANVGLGTGWRLDVFRRLTVEANDDVTFVDADGARHRFTNPTGSTIKTYTRPATLYATLTRDTGATPDRFTLTYIDQGRDLFDELATGTGYLVREEDRFGNGVDLAYSGANLATITDSVPAPDRVIDFTWDTGPTPDRLTAITDWAYISGGVVQTSATGSRRVHDFFYDGSGRLEGWTDPLDTTSTSCSTPRSHLTCLTYANGLVSAVTKTQTITDNDGGTLGTDDREVSTLITYTGTSVASVTDAQEAAQGSPEPTTFTAESATVLRVDRPTTTTSYGQVAANDPYGRIQSVWRKLDGSTSLETRTTYDGTYPIEPATVTENYGALLSTPARTTTYAYVASSMGLVSKIVEPLDGADDRWTEFTYNANNDVTLETVSLEGSTNEGERTITKYCYETQSNTCATSEDGLTLVRRIDRWVSGGGSDEDTNVVTDFAYDGYGQLTATTRVNRNGAGSILDEREDRQTHDDKGNLTATITNYDDGDVDPDSGDTEPVSAGAGRTDLTTTHTYDTAGNQVSSADPRRAIGLAATTEAHDEFDRSVSDDWGSADIGGSWSGTTADFDVASGIGTISLGSNTNRNAQLASTSLRDLQLLVKVRVDRLAVGSDHFVWFFLRRQDDSNYYQARLQFTTTGKTVLSLREVDAGTTTVLDAATGSAPHSTTDWYWLRVQLTGSTTLDAKARLWRDGETEPGGWTVEALDASPPAALQNAGNLGLRFQLGGSYSGSYPVVASFDDLSLTSPGGGGPEIDPDDYVSRTTYDALDRPITTSTPTTPGVATASRTATTTYDELGNVRSASDVADLVTATLYDRVGRALETYEDPDPAGSAATTAIATYDEDGRVLTTKDRAQVADADLGHTATSYDGLGRPTTVTAAASSSPNVSADTDTTYDGLDRVTVTEIGGTSSQRTTYTYDLGGRTLETDDDYTCRTATYDYRDLARVVTDSAETSTCTPTADSREVTHTYDGLGRLVSSEVTDGPDDGDQPFIATYDSVGNTQSSADDTASTLTTTTYTVDRLDQVIVEERADGSTAKTTYDPVGNPVDRCTWASGTAGACLAVGSVGWTDPPTNSTTTRWDARNGRIGLTDAVSNQTTTYDPDAGYQVAAVYLPTDADQTKEHQSIYGYDARQRLTGITHQLCTVVAAHTCLATTATGSVAYAYDDNDNRTTVDEDNGASAADYRYCHDARDQLVARRSGAACTSSPDESYTYDDAGNRLSATTAGPVTTNFAYTAEGLLCDIEIGSAASCTGGNVGSDDAGRISDQAGWHYLYDAQSRLVSACDDDDCVGSGFERVDFTYDGEGRRTAILATPASGPAVETTFRYQGDAIVAEYLDATLTREYVTDDGGTISKVIVPSGASAGTYLVTWNGHGDAMALYRIESDGSLTLANSYTYSTWGTPTTATHNGIADLGFRFLYVGAYDVQWDASLGLYYMHARHYSPTLGRFLQPDPSRLDAQLFVYAGNGPVSRVDPSGLCIACKKLGGGGKGGGAIGGGGGGGAKGAVGGTAARLVARYASREAARADLANTKSAILKAASEFFKNAPSNSASLKIVRVTSNRFEISAWSPARNPGYGKMYKLVVDSNGKKILKFKYNWDQVRRVASKVEIY